MAYQFHARYTTKIWRSRITTLQLIKTAPVRTVRYTLYDTYSSEPPTIPIRPVANATKLSFQCRRCKPMAYMQHTCLALVHFRGKRRNDLLDFTEIWNLGRHIESIERSSGLANLLQDGIFFSPPRR